MKANNENNKPKIFRSSYNTYMKLMLASTIYSHIQDGGSQDKEGTFSFIKNKNFFKPGDLRAH